jgi:DNA-binding PadR family transcriptional regulator
MRHNHSHHPHGHHGLRDETRRFARGLLGRLRHGEPSPGHAPGDTAGEGRQGHHHRGGRFRLARLFEHGDLRLVILQLIADKPRHGYELIKAIEDLAGGAYAPSPGVVYPTLTLLEELGFVSVTAGEGPRKLHSITEAGTAHLAANKPGLDAILARVAELTPSGGPPLPVIRAMENLKLALRLRMSRGALSADEVQAIAAAIDAAAEAVERS